MKDVTITLHEDIAQWARIRAAEQEMSLSRLIEGLLREKMREEETYEAAMGKYLSTAPRYLKEPGSSYPMRKDLYDR